MGSARVHDELLILGQGSNQASAVPPEAGGSHRPKVENFSAHALPLSLRWIDNLVQAALWVSDGSWLLSA